MIISQYADVATFFKKYFVSLDSLLSLLHTFTTVSGLRINHHKTHLLLLGHHIDPPEEFQNISVKDQIMILGITFRNHMSDDQQYQLNFAPKLTKIRKVCSTWLNLNLSLKGKTVFWSGKRAKISYNLLIQDLATRIKAIHLYWIKFLWNNPDSVLAAILTESVAYNSVQDLLGCKSDLTKQLEKGGPFFPTS